MGASGAALGTAISLIIGNGITMNIIYAKYIGLDVLKFWRNVLPIIFTAIIPVLIGIGINHILPKVSLVKFIIKSLIFLVAYLISEYIIAVNNEEKLMFNRIYISKIKRK